MTIVLGASWEVLSLFHRGKLLIIELLMLSLVDASAQLVVYFFLLASAISMAWMQWYYVNGLYFEKHNYQVCDRILIKVLFLWT